MTWVDWLIVLSLNGAIVAVGVRLARRTQTTFDWYLAAKGLPWWLAGASMFATAVDSGDYVAVVGGAYTFGLSNLATWWIGMPVGWFVVAYFVFVPVYRGGMYTNAEYLEYRFSPAVRLVAALIQIQYRTNVLGNIGFSLYLAFSFLAGWGSETWWLVVAIALAAGVYSAAGGLQSVVVTDALQSILMFIAAIVLWLTLWNAVGGYGGLEMRLAAISPTLADNMLKIGSGGSAGVPAILVVFGWCMAHTAYCVVNHSQAMRMLAAKSECDMRTAALFASVLTVVVMGFNVSLGVIGRALYPDLATPDTIYPRMVADYLGPGVVGLVVGGVLAGGISTYDSIGSSLGAVFTRDIYQRFVAPGRSDAHYLFITRWSTLGMIAVSFAYIPFLGGGMVALYLRLTSVAVVPLCTVYLMGSLTRVPRRAGAIGLGVGVLYGVSSLLGEWANIGLPIWWTNTWWAYLWATLLTAGAMLLTRIGPTEPGIDEWVCTGATLDRTAAAALALLATMAAATYFLW